MDQSTTENHEALQTVLAEKLEALAEKELNHMNIMANDDVDEIDGRNVHIPRTIYEKDDHDDDDDPTKDHFQLDNVSNSYSSQSRRPSYQIFANDIASMIESNGVIMPTIDVNAYQHKKTLAKGMMDLALLSANANQLRYVLDSFERHPYPMASLIFITISIVFQIAVGVGLILNARLNIKDEKEIHRADKINNYTVIGIFIITIVNVFIVTFGVSDNSK